MHLLQHIRFAQMQFTKYARAQFLDNDEGLARKLLHLAIGLLLVDVGEISAHIQIVMMRFASPACGCRRGRGRIRRAQA